MFLRVPFLFSQFFLLDGSWLVAYDDKEGLLVLTDFWEGTQDCWKDWPLRWRTIR